jgi:hypothetical protein
MTSTMYTQRPASEKSINYLVALLAERIEDEVQSLAAITWVQEHNLSQALVSAKIKEYEGKPKFRNAFRSTPELPEGMYRCDGEIYKVYTTRGDEGRAPQLVTKQLIEGSFEYTGKRPLRFLRDEHRMTLEEAKEYGKVTGTCCVCGRKLTNEASIADGIGPVCSGKV